MWMDTLPAGDRVCRDQKSIQVSFAGKRRVLSTCPLNGGYREDLTGVFNYDETPDSGTECLMRAPTYEEHMALIAGELRLDPAVTAGMSTAAQMANAAIQSERFEDVSVTAIVTGGIEVNGGRVGDPAFWHETAGVSREIVPGTINILLFFDADLTGGALARALVTCTEAKAAALQELLAPSRYSMGIATGSGTDTTLLACRADSPVRLTNAGKHSKLGELIGRVVREAVKEALRLQTGLSPAKQHDLLRRMDRFGITGQSLWEASCPGGISRKEFEARLSALSRREELVVAASLYAHLLDQLLWDLLTPGEAARAGAELLSQMSPGFSSAPLESAGKEAALVRMIGDFQAALNRLLSESPV